MKRSKVIVMGILLLLFQCSCGNTDVNSNNGLNDASELINQYTHIKRDDALSRSEGDASEDTTAIMESHMTFPSVFVLDLGITLVYPDYSDDSLPAYIAINSETNLNNISINGALPGMKFEEIKNRLGDEEVKKSWISSEDVTAYKLEYVLNGITYSFQSYAEDGEASELYIHNVVD
ncbi:hypothetical protein H8B09_19165 [Paenibacillus sp. PR3]|uniref:DUF5590 domain-containing protein n=1 Tax=Paenibacillus terricola TaxID=2763503 RepID=A0ABR8N122_9BACL|nr:hypothetical protein [Paenibacillus terricola]MBD3920895.1 hypothetical protein [Paenibacillus terricola]